MNSLMTVGAQCDEIGVGVVSEAAARFDMVNLKLDETSAILAAPAIALEYLAP